MSYLNQSQVPDGMVANVPWGMPFERWSDRMIERALIHLDGGDRDKRIPDGEGDMFPNLFRHLGEVARERGIEV